MNIKCVVLDLNGTLVLRKRRKLEESPPSLKYKGYFVYARPNIQRLASYLHTNNIPYVFWSTALMHNILPMTDYLSSLGLDRPIGILDQKSCSGNTKAELVSQAEGHAVSQAEGHAVSQPSIIVKEDNSINYIKDLNVVADTYGFNLEEVVLIDDSPAKRMGSQKYIRVEEYDSINKEDEELIRVCKEISRLKE